MLHGHFDVSNHPSAHRGYDAVSFDPVALQRVLDHDNHETRRAMKDLMKDDLFVP
jgi:hypothetical protein